MCLFLFAFDLMPAVGYRDVSHLFIGIPTRKSCECDRQLSGTKHLNKHTFELEGKQSTRQQEEAVRLSQGHNQLVSFPKCSNFIQRYVQNTCISNHCCPVEQSSGSWLQDLHIYKWPSVIVELLSAALAEKS